MKGQMTFEFLGTITIAMLIYAIFYMVIITQFAGILPWNTQNYEAGFYANKVAEQVTIAYTAGDGYYGSFELPEQIRGKEYLLAYNSDAQALEIDIIDEGDIDSYGLAFFIAEDVVIKNAGNGTNYIANTNGTVVVWQQ